MPGSTVEADRRRLIRSFRFPLFFVVLIWLVKFFELLYNTNFGQFGIYPMSLSGLAGIITSPLIHGNFNHLFANSGPLLFLGAGVSYFYPRQAMRLWLMAWIFTGFLVWLSGRASYHIGASGIIYCFASFLFFGGIIKRNTSLMAISLLIAFLYGGMFWGILPTKSQISWEAHLMGFLTGIYAAIRFKNYGPSRKKYPWEPDTHQDHDNNNLFESDSSLEDTDISIHYRKKEE